MAIRSITTSGTVVGFVKRTYHHVTEPEPKRA
jgi:hypothetical protein